MLCRSCPITLEPASLWHHVKPPCGCYPDWQVWHHLLRDDVLAVVWDVPCASGVCRLRILSQGGTAVRFESMFTYAFGECRLGLVLSTRSSVQLLVQASLSCCPCAACSASRLPHRQCAARQCSLRQDSLRAWHQPACLLALPAHAEVYQRVYQQPDRVSHAQVGVSSHTPSRTPGSPTGAPATPPASPRTHGGRAARQPILAGSQPWGLAGPCSA